MTTVCKLCKEILTPTLIQTGADAPQIAGAADLFAYGEACRSIHEHLARRHPEVIGVIANAMNQYALAVGAKFADCLDERFSEQWDAQARFAYWTLAGEVKISPAPPAETQKPR
ncbi:MAG: hypothetical protein CUN53_00080 [Phototrophicales bacterium]|nr:MAG: hypothetical protein CUN53_00080 [Phototrophicales bacterium]